jgi:hypothetical protein
VLKPHKAFCPKCKQLAVVSSYGIKPDTSVLRGELSCGCEWEDTLEQPWIAKWLAYDEGYAHAVEEIHKWHASQCPCAACRNAREGLLLT